MHRGKENVFSIPQRLPSQHHIRPLSRNADRLEWRCAYVREWTLVHIYVGNARLEIRSPKRTDVLHWRCAPSTSASRSPKRPFVLRSAESERREGRQSNEAQMPHLVAVTGAGDKCGQLPRISRGSITRNCRNQESETAG